MTGVTGAAAAGAAAAASNKLEFARAFVCWVMSTAMMIVLAKKKIASQTVPFWRTLVVWAPNICSVMPPPNEDPSPSCRGFCHMTMRTSKRARKTWMIERIVMAMSMGTDNLGGKRAL